jgi:hypothetical protein
MDCHRHKDGRVGMLCVGVDVIRRKRSRFVMIPYLDMIIFVWACDKRDEIWLGLPGREKNLNLVFYGKFRVNRDSGTG